MAKFPHHRSKPVEKQVLYLLLSVGNILSCLEQDACHLLTVGCPCRHMKREGTIAFNGQPSTKRLKRNIGFVMQVDST